MPRPPTGVMPPEPSVIRSKRPSGACFHCAERGCGAVEDAARPWPSRSSTGRRRRGTRSARCRSRRRRRGVERDAPARCPRCRPSWPRPRRRAVDAEREPLGGLDVLRPHRWRSTGPRARPAPATVNGPRRSAPRRRRSCRRSWRLPQRAVIGGQRHLRRRLVPAELAVAAPGERGGGARRHAVRAVDAEASRTPRSSRESAVSETLRPNFSVSGSPRSVIVARDLLPVLAVGRTLGDVRPGAVGADPQPDVAVRRRDLRTGRDLRRAVARRHPLVLREGALGDVGDLRERVRVLALPEDEAGLLALVGERRDVELGLDLPAARRRVLQQDVLRGGLACRSCRRCGPSSAARPLRNVRAAASPRRIVHFGSSVRARRTRR